MKVSLCNVPWSNCKSNLCCTYLFNIILSPSLSSHFQTYSTILCNKNAYKNWITFLVFVYLKSNYIIKKNYAYARYVGHCRLYLLLLSWNTSSIVLFPWEEWVGGWTHKLHCDIPWKGTDTPFDLWNLVWWQDNEQTYEVKYWGGCPTL